MTLRVLHATLLLVIAFLSTPPAFARDVILSGRPDETGWTRTLNNLIREVSAEGGGTILIRPAVYGFRGTIVLRNLVHLVGEQAPTARSGRATLVPEGSDSTIVVTGVGASMRNLTVTPDQSVNHVPIIQLQQCSFFRIHRCLITAFSNDAISAEQSHDLFIDNCGFRQFDANYSIHMEQCDRVQVLDNTFDGGVLSMSGSHFSVLRNLLESTIGLPVADSAAIFMNAPTGPNQIEGNRLGQIGRGGNRADTNLVYFIHSRQSPPVTIIRNNETNSLLPNLIGE